jgi:2-oxoglutarate dehydrogenase E2 component (dihydrolipoamide succinyltransferase)
MPQMGESIAEGTVSKWLKQVGDAVDRDEPILEISTDKVDAEIPSPSAGVLVEIVVAEGETVEVGTVVAYVDTEASAGATVETPPAAATPPAPEAPAAEAVPVAPAAPPESPPPAGFPPEVAVSTGAPAPSEEAPTVEGGVAAGAAAMAEGVATAEERLRTRSTPVVRRIAQEHGVALAAVQGTGHAGRVTKQDILDYIESGASRAQPPVTEVAPETATETTRIPEPTPAAAPVPSAAAPAPTAPPSEFWKTFYGQVQHPEFPVREADTVETMDKIRRLTAEHMVVAKRVAPHVHSFIEIDFSRIDQIRRENKARWAEQGARVSFTAFVAWACSRALREFPMVNATISGNNMIYRGNVNLGMAVDLNPGLIVPVIHDADDLSLVGVAKKIIDLAERARSRKLVPTEIQGATFSITNPGVLGTLVGLPVIPKGTAAILGTGAIEKRVVVVEDPLTGADSISIRKRSLFSLGYDHRIVDGADAARYLSRLKEMLEGFPEDA